jgi:hypothetical protein
MTAKKTNPTKNIIDYVKNHSRKDSLLYNNRLFFGMVRKTEKVCAEYSANRKFIMEYFAI